MKLEMFRSIKFKFTAFFAGTIAVVVLAFGVVALVNNNSLRQPVTEITLDGVVVDNPRIRRFLEENTNVDEIREISKLLRDQAVDQSNRALLILIPTVILAGTAMAFVLSSYLVEPIERVSNKIQKLGSKNLSARVDQEKSSTEVEVLTDRINQLMDELEDAFKAQEQFIGDAAHELRTPLAAMKTHLEVHRQTGKKPSEELVTVVEKLNDQLIYLSEKLLFLNRSHTRNRTDSISLSPVVEDVIEAVEPMADKKKIEIKFEPPKKPVRASIEMDDLVKLVRNLLENAVKYSLEEKVVEVKLSNSKSYAKILIKDQGIGISEADLPNIFDRFYRSDKAVKHDEGSGLGLSIVKKVVQSYGGKIEVTSKIDEGTEFIVQLPI